MKQSGLEIVKLPIDSLTPYKRNAKKHPPEQVEQIKESIRLYGNNDPIAVWGRKNMIVEGHGRFLALKELGYTEVECVRLDHLTAQERREYTLVHNQTTMNSGFDIPALKLELGELPNFKAADFGFDLNFSLPGYPESAPEDLEPYRPPREAQEDRGAEPQEVPDWFADHESGAATDEDSEEYQAFVEKFKPKKTTDDCYTPANIYEAVAAWVAKEYGVDRACFVRPFYPGGDYQREQYPPECVVVDNPPFSILTEIVRFYVSQNVRFFLFAPALSLFTAKGTEGISYLCTYVSITYENGASVNTSFITNLDNCLVRSTPDLHSMIKAANAGNLKAMHKQFPKYAYPDNVITAPMVGRYSKFGIDFRVSARDCARIGELDAQKEQGKAIYGDGYLLSDKAAQERAAAEQWANERAIQSMIDKAAQERAAAEQWALSEREKAIVKSLGGNRKGAAECT